MDSTHGHPPIGAAAHAGAHAAHPSGLDPETGHVHPHVVTKSPGEITREILAATHHVGPTYKLALLITGALLVIGIIGFIMRAATAEAGKYAPWGYFMAGFSFLLTTAMSAPIVSIGQRMLRSHWRRPITRASELFTVVGIFGALLFIPLVLLLPPTGHTTTVAEAGPCVAALSELSGLPWAGDGCRVIDRPSIWWGFPGTPHVTDILAVASLAVLGVMFLMVCAWPDLAAYRPMTTGFRRTMLNMITLGEWTGSEKQWAVQKGAIHILGALYFFMLIFVHTIVVSDFGMSLVPRWVDSIFPATAGVNGIQCGLASTIIAMYILRHWGGMRDYIALDQFWAAAKLLLAFSLLWFYFWFSGFIIYWYGRQPGEMGILGTLMFQSYRAPFLLAFLCSFLLPFIMLVWNASRKSMLAPFIVSIIILFGAMFDKVRIYMASFHTADLHPDALTSAHPEPILVTELVPPRLPDVMDIMMLLGVIGGAIFIYLVAAKIIPPVSIWHIKEGTMYRKMVPYMKTHILLMGKPD